MDAPVAKLLEIQQNKFKVLRPGEPLRVPELR